MKIDLDSMSMKDLRDLHQQVTKAMSGFEERKRMAALAALEDKARELGFSLPELLSGSTSKKRRPAKAKFANPANPAQTWTGRGRKPRWIEAALSSGKSLDDMLI